MMAGNGERDRIRRVAELGGQDRTGGSMVDLNAVAFKLALKLRGILAEIVPTAKEISPRFKRRLNSTQKPPGKRRNATLVFLHRLPSGFRIVFEAVCKHRHEVSFKTLGQYILPTLSTSSLTISLNSSGSTTSTSAPHHNTHRLISRRSDSSIRSSRLPSVSSSVVWLLCQIFRPPAPPPRA